MSEDDDWSNMYDDVEDDSAKIANIDLEKINKNEFKDELVPDKWELPEKSTSIKTNSVKNDLTISKKSKQKVKKIIPIKQLTREEIKELEIISDLENAKTLFEGMDDKEKIQPKSLAEKILTFEPQDNQTDFTFFAQILADIILPFDHSINYCQLLKELLNVSTKNLSVDDLKELEKTLSIITNEKLKKSKGKKGGRGVKSKGVKLNIKSNLKEDADFEDVAYFDVVEDFM